MNKIHHLSYAYDASHLGPRFLSESEMVTREDKESYRIGAMSRWKDKKRSRLETFLLKWLLASECIES